MTRILLGTCALLVACAPALDVPRDLVINCDGDTQCPAAMSCRGQVCIRDAELDRVPPTLVSAQAAGPQAVVLTFSERVKREEAENLANYGAVPPLAFVSATLGGESQTVVIAVQRQSAVTYELTVANVRDESDNVIAPPTNSSRFNGVPPPIDTTAPEPLLPALHQRFLGATHVELRWSERSGAARYQIDLAFDVAFQNHVPGSPFTVLPLAEGGVPETTLRVAAPVAVTYFWRVRADTTEGTPIVYDFDVVRDALHVYCQSYPGCDGAGAAGNVTRPYPTISRALANAKLDGIKRVLVAGRGVGQPYEELVTLVDGVSLHGGYDPTFDESQRNAETRIRGSSTFTIYAERITQKTTVERFTIMGGHGRLVHTVEAKLADGLLLIDDVIDNGHGQHESIAVHIEDSGRDGGLKPALIGCSVVDVDEAETQDVADTERGVDAIRSHVRIERSTIASGDANGESSAVRVSGSVMMSDSSASSGAVPVASGSRSHGVWLELRAGAPSSRIERNVLQGGAADESGGLYATGSGMEAPVIVNNVISSGVGGSVSRGAQLSHGVFVNNTVSVLDCTQGTSCQRFAVLAVLTTMPNANATVIANNILFGQGDRDHGACLGIGTSAAFPFSPQRIENNLMFDCPDAFVRYLHNMALGTELVAMADVNDVTKYLGAPPTSATGNVTDAAAASYFTSWATGDWSLMEGTPAAIAGGGLDASSATYGAVTVDITSSVPRTCNGPGACFTMGAYELD